MKLLHVTTVAESFVFMRGQLAFMKERGFEIVGVTSPGPLVDVVREREGIEMHTVEMPRRITPVQDLVALTELTLRIRQIGPDIVHGHTPKGGLLAMIAATLAGVDRRVYHMRGLPMETAVGAKRALLATTERISCGLATKVITVGRTMAETAVAEGLCRRDKITYLAGGSSNGVDAAGRFNPEKQPPGRREEIRSRYGIPADGVVIGFLGRMVGDKGIVELARAWAALRHKHSDLHLLLVGPFEERDAVDEEVRRRLREDPRVHMTGLVEDTAAHYVAMDVLTLPTHREGFPNAPLEGAAMGLPVVASDIGPCQEAVAEGKTGTLHRVGDAGELEDALERYVCDPELRRRHGQAGRERMLAEFRPEQIWEGIYEVYREVLGEGSEVGGRFVGQ